MPDTRGAAGRFFLGIALTEEARDALRVRLRTLELPGRIVPAENWHLTLAFLGDTSSEALERLRAGLGDAELGPGSEITFGSVGAFPNPARASVLWLGLTAGEEAVLALHGRVSAAVRRAGFAVEEGRFVPHLTLARVQPPRDVRRLLERASPPEVRMLMEAVTLFRSHLGTGPARYEAVEQYELVAADRERPAP
jgi:RNA 2',3'-cyclic 3'-phosphodiesterase